MEPQPLPLAAEKIRKEMDALISKVTTFDEDERGNKKYGGDELEDLVSRMKATLRLDDVDIDIPYLHGIPLILVDLGSTTEILVGVYIIDES